MDLGDISDVRAHVVGPLDEEALLELEERARRAGAEVLEASGEGDWASAGFRPTDAGTWEKSVVTRPYTVIQAPIPALDAVASARWRRWAPDFLRIDGGVHAHVTLLAPFLDHPSPETLDAVGAVLRTPAFDVTFARVGRFPDGLCYLEPDPEASQRFVRLTSSLVAAFPQCVPYGGRADVVPHLSLDHGEPGELADEIRLPVASAVDRVELVRYEAGRTRALATWYLGRRSLSA